MQLSELYRNQTDTKKFYIEGSSSGAYVAFNQSRRYIDMYTDKTEFDKSCVYTMCTDESMNIVSQYNNYSCNVNHITVDFKQFKHNNSIIFNYWNNTDTISDFALTEKQEMTGWLTLLTNVNIQNYLFYPKVWVIEKDNLTFAGDNYTCLSQSDVVLVSLKQLYENKDKYVVVDFNCKSYYVLSNRYYMGVAIPYRCFFNGSYITGGVIGCSNGTGFQANKTFGGTTNYGQRGTGGTATVWIKGRNFDDTTSNYVFSCIYPLDIDNKKDNTYEFIERENGGWIVKHGATSFACKNYWTADYILKLFASLGVYVVWDNILPTGETLKNSSHTAIGEMDDNGFTTGKFILPNEKATSTSPNLNYNDFTDSIADPDKYKPIIPNNSVDLAEQKLSTFGQINQFVKYYWLDETDLGNLHTDIKASVVSKPMDYIISLQAIPDQIFSSLNHSDSKSTIVIESWTADTAKGYRITGSTCNFEVGDYAVKRINNNYLDFSPYMDLLLYVPYVGSIPLPTDMVMGREINVKMLFDFENGDCSAIIFCEGGIVASGHGSLEKPYTLSTSNFNYKIVSSSLNLLGVATAAMAVPGLGLAAAAGAGGMMISSFAKNMSDVKPGSNNIINFKMPQKCCLFYSYPYHIEEESYGKSVGYACNKYGVLSDFHGYTQCVNPHVEIVATEEEKQRLYEKLTNGVILP